LPTRRKSEESEMSKKVNKTNEHLLTLIQDLYEASHKEDAPIWRDVARRLERSNRLHSEVNVGKIDRVASKNDKVVVPGKVLGSGDLTKPVHVAAWRFSNQAREKIEAAGGKALSIPEMVSDVPKGSGVRLMG
jgi:large subunit ribosomal protein L18e